MTNISFISIGVMRTAMIRLVFSALCWLAVLAGPLKQEWIELSHPFNNDTIYWPTSLKFKHTEVLKVLLTMVIITQHMTSAAVNTGALTWTRPIILLRASGQQMKYL